MTEEKHTCECVVHDPRSYIDAFRSCGKPAKGQCTSEFEAGKWACGTHLNADRKRVEADAAYEDKKRADKRYTERLNALSEKLGLELKTYYSSVNDGYVYDQAVVNINDLLRVLGCEEGTK